MVLGKPASLLNGCAALLASLVLLVGCVQETTPAQRLAKVAGESGTDGITTISLSDSLVEITTDGQRFSSSEPGASITIKEQEPSPEQFGRPLADFHVDELSERLTPIECAEDRPTPFVFAWSLVGGSILVADGCAKWDSWDVHHTLLDGRELQPFTDFTAQSIDDAVADLELAIGSQVTEVRLVHAVPSKGWTDQVSATAPSSEDHDCAPEAVRYGQEPEHGPGLLLALCNERHDPDATSFSLNDIDGAAVVAAWDTLRESMDEAWDIEGQPLPDVHVISEDGRLLLSATGAILDHGEGTDLRVPLDPRDG